MGISRAGTHCCSAGHVYTSCNLFFITLNECTFPRHCMLLNVYPNGHEFMKVPQNNTSKPQVVRLTSLACSKAITKVPAHLVRMQCCGSWETSHTTSHATDVRQKMETQTTAHA